MRLPHLLMVALAGCTTVDPSQTTDDPFASARASLLDFEFDGQLTSSSASNLTGQIRGQLMYTLGQLNGEYSVTRLSKLVLSGITTSTSGGLYVIKYHAKLPVAWGTKDHLPSSYTFKLPKRADSTGQTNFTNKYGRSCNDG